MNTQQRLFVTLVMLSSNRHFISLHFIIHNTCPQEVPVDQSSLDYLGKGTQQAYLGIQQLEETPETGGDGGLSGGAIAGIVIGCLAAGLIIGAALFIWYKKSGGTYFSYQGDATAPLKV